MSEDERIAVPGGRLIVPAGWKTTTAAAPARLLVSAPEADPGHRANFNLVLEDPDQPPAGLGQHLEALRDLLPDHHLVDLEECTVAGLPVGVRLLSLHTTDGEGLVTEQWVTDGAAGRWVLSATCLAMRYDEYAEIFAAVAASWELDEADRP